MTRTPAFRTLVYLVAPVLMACGGSGSNDDQGTQQMLDGSVADSSEDDGATQTNDDGAIDTADLAPPHRVGACDKLGAAGTIENITPTQLNPGTWCDPGDKSCPGTGQKSTYGAHLVTLDPVTSGTLYLGTDSMGLWKSTNCGAAWTKINTGKNGTVLDGGRQWTIAIDPTDPQVIYTVSGYGTSGVFKSTNGGVDFDQVLTDNITSQFQYKGFMEEITIDPTSHTHILASFHEQCPSLSQCMAESTDAGKTWSFTGAPQQFNEGFGQTMLDSKTWLYGDNFNGMWRTVDAGKNWTVVYAGEASGAVLPLKDGSFIAAGGQDMLQSADGINWSTLANSHGGASVNGSNPVTTDGTSIYMSQGAYGGEEPSTGWYWKAPIKSPTQWTPAFTAATMSRGGSNLVYDADHKLLFSSNLTAGVFRVVVQ
jgi:hypothetical protein